jgi:hypothetical protein
MLTPTQRHDLVTNAIDQLRDLGLALVPVTSCRAWLVDSDRVKKAYDNLAKTVRVMMREVDWPGGRTDDDSSLKT